MQADATLLEPQHRHFKNALLHALYHIAVDEGVLSVWNCAVPSAVGTMALNLGMRASNDQSAVFFIVSLGMGELGMAGKSFLSPTCYFFFLARLPISRKVGAVSGFYALVQMQKMRPDTEGICGVLKVLFTAWLGNFRILMNVSVAANDEAIGACCGSPTYLLGLIWIQTDASLPEAQLHCHDGPSALTGLFASACSLSFAKT